MRTKGSVTVFYYGPGDYDLEPPIGILDRNVQTMQWTLVVPNGSTARFRDDKDGGGIVFNPPPELPPGFSEWPGEVPLREDDWQIRAKANHKVPEGAQLQLYRYDIYVDPGDGGIAERVQVRRPDAIEKIDPGMENQPQP